ncbi:TPA: type IA DNA topoisomerase [Burkholderia vietnamiensis]|nr:type IA DNA topoisomerase [Burkholderia vietnamiensis]
MKDVITLVVEKPLVLRELAPTVSTRWPSTTVYAITTRYLGLYEFRYPRGLRYDAFPFVGTPIWKPRSWQVPLVWKVDVGTASPCNIEPCDALREASEVWYAGAPDPSDAVTFHVLLSQCLGDEAAALPRPAIYLVDLRAEAINAAFDAPRNTKDEWFESIRHAGIARRYFDFNFNVNSLALLGTALRDAGVTVSDFMMSKYSLQLLYWLADDPHATFSSLIQAMQEWRGTGRYAPALLGSPASRVEIIQGLQDAGLAVPNAAGQVRLTSTGRRFLQLLHPDCRDADLPARMAEWERTWPESRPKVESYIRTFFGKQKRFAKASTHTPRVG